MSYRTIVWGTGRVGSDAITGVVGHPDLELVGAWVHSAEKDGRDVGELFGVGPIGVVATRDGDALLGLDADCVIFSIARTWGEDGVESGIALLERILRSGKNVVNVWWPALVHAPALGDGTYERLERAALDGGATLHTGGIDPGIGNLGLALMALQMTGDVRSVRTFEILNYAHWNNPSWIRSHLGFGGHEVGTLFTSGQLISTFAPMLHLMAESMGVEIDEIVQDYSVTLADEDFDVPAGHIAAGTICGIRFEVKAVIDGAPRLVVEHVTRLRDDDFPELNFTGGGYRAEIEGQPNVRMDMSLSWPDVEPGSIFGGGSGRPAIRALAMSLVNAVPQVCDSAPGVLSYVDMTPHPSRNLRRDQA